MFCLWREAGLKSRAVQSQRVRDRRRRKPIGRGEQPQYPEGANVTSGNADSQERIATAVEAEQSGGAAHTPLKRTIALVGLMGAGKSSVGRRLAAKLGAPFYDADEEIELAAGMSVAEIFEHHGEAHFRDGERKVIARLIGNGPSVLATGGGAFVNDETRALLKAQAVTVWLRADLDVLVERTSRRKTRPLLLTGDPRQILGDLIEARTPHYSQAEYSVESLGGEPHEVMVARIIEALKDSAAFRPDSEAN